MVQAALTANAERQVREDDLPTTERIPASQRLSLPSSQERIPVSKRLGSSASLAPRLDHGDCEMVEMQESEERIPATLRIGHPPIPQQENEPGVSSAPVKRKPGRPPGVRKGPVITGTIPSVTAASNRRVRKVPGGKPSPIRRPSKSSKAKAAVGPPRGKNQAGASTTSSENMPICNMIPRTSRRRMDFRIPSAPGP